MREEVTYRLAMMLIAVAVVLLAGVLTIGGDQTEVVVPLLGWPLPPLCTLKRYTGLDCPGCGLTRSFIALAHGDSRGSLTYNPAGVLWFVLIAAQIPWHAWQLVRLSRQRSAIDPGWWGHGLLLGAAFALICQWVVRQCGWF